MDHMDHTENLPAQKVVGATPPDFDAIRHFDENGREYWLARELYPLLGYSRWQRFIPVVTKAQEACVSSNINVEDHFTNVGKMVELGSGGQRQVEDIALSRYACYLIVQNGDPAKPVIAAGQTYFAIQTRHGRAAPRTARGRKGQFQPAQTSLMMWELVKVNGIIRYAVPS